MVGFTTTPSIPALTGAEITTLAAKITGHKFPRASTKQAAVNRLVKALGDDKRADGVFKQLRKVTTFKDAERIIERLKMEDTQMNAAPVKKAKATKTKAPKEPRANGGRSQFAGKTLYPNVESNPRRPGSHGHKSLEVIIAHPDGISVDDYVAKGGRTKDLRWDYAKGQIKAK